MSTVDDRSPLMSKHEIRKHKLRVERQQAIAAEYQQYRSLSFLPLLTLVTGVTSTPILFVAQLNPFLLAFPLLGMLLGGYTVLWLRGREAEYVGTGYARIGLAAATLSFCAGTGWAIYTYATEVPDGYERISFSDLQPTPGRKDPYSTKAEDLTAKKVFVKGYVYPDGQLDDIKRFVLVPDMGTCCFGGQPKLTDMIQVTLEDPLRTRYSFTRRKFAGTFRLAATSADQVGTVIYQLEADYAK